jgi:hypothetical protein
MDHWSYPRPSGSGHTWGRRGPGSTRESRNPQPLRLRFRARLTEDGAGEVELIRARGDSYVADT